MLTTGQIIKKLREQNKWTQEELANKIGYSHKSSIGKIEKGKTVLSQSKVKEFAEIFNVPVSIIMGEPANIEHRNQTKEIPLLGQIACGTPILANENIEEYIPVSVKSQVDFALRAKGDSMINARIQDGDIVYIHQQSMVENGEIAAVRIEDEATLKRVYYYPQRKMMILKPENPEYEDMIYQGKELNDIEIIGKAILFLSEI